MLLNPFALISLFVGAISLFLMAAAVFSALFFYRRLRGSEGADEKAQAENGIYLALLFLFTALLLRLVAWPLFYILLQSLIPLVPGAMCIFGVTQVKPIFVAFLQLLKPLAFFLIGGWLIFYGMDLSLRSRLLMGKSVRFLMAVTAIAVTDAAAELLFILDFEPPGVAVSCCTVVADLAVPPAPILPAPLLGVQYHHILLAFYHGFNLGLIALLGFLLWRKRTQKEGINRRGWLTLIAIAALMNGAITYGAFKEYLGPLLMDLPDHHCLYCLLQYRPVSIAILGLFILGLFFAMWPALLNRMAAVSDAKRRAGFLNRHLFKWAIGCLFASWLMTAALA